MILVDLIPRPIAQVFDFWKPSQVEATAQLDSRDQIEEATAQLQHTSLDNQDLRSSSEMPKNPPNDQNYASGGGGEWKTVGRPVSGTGPHRNRADHRSGREDLSQSRPRAQSAHLKKVESDYRQLADSHGLLQHNYDQLSEAHQSVITDLRETQTMCQGQQQEIKTLRKKLSDNSVLLDVRNQELKVAKTFLSKEDPFSTSDVVQAVRDLNSEIMQTAAHLAETLPLKRLRTPSAQEVPEGCCKSIFVTLVLAQRFGEEVDVGSLELALQGFLALYVSAIANAWSFSHGYSWCDMLYSKVCETEDHTVASNWRVITRRALGHMDSSHENLPRGIIDNMISQLADLLAFCGVGTPIDNATNIQIYGAEKLETLSTAARKLNTMVGENVVSEDLVVTVVSAGTIFDGECMEDAYPQAGMKPVQRVVICTTDLGLREGKQVKGVKAFLKPKVVLRDS